MAGTGQNAEKIRQTAVSTFLGIPEQEARTEYYKASAETTRGKPQLELDLARIKGMKSPEEITKIRAETYRALMAGDLDAAQAKQVNTLLDQKDLAQKLGNTKLQQDIDSQLEVLFPKAGGGTEKGLVPARDIAEFMTRKEIAEIGARGGDKNLPREKFDVEKEQTAVDIEKIINTNSDSPEALARYEDFNRYSNRPRVAVNDGGDIKFINLPTVGGKIINARQVYKAASDRNMSVEQFLAEVLKVPEAIKLFK